MIVYKNILLEKMLRMKQNTLKKFIKKNLKEQGYEVTNKDGYLYAEGEHPVLLVAHMDTVHRIPVQTIIRNEHVISSPEGIGGDDRCGCYLILKMIQEIKCSVLFLEDEEIGCIGATKFTRNFDYSKINVNYIVEFDRRGNNHCVFYECDNPEFEKFITSTGYFETHYGSYTDICEVAPQIGVAAVNLSSGYYNEHSKEETINLLELDTIFNEAKKLIEQKTDKYEYIECKYSWYKRNFGYDYSYDDDFDYDFGYQEETYCTEEKGDTKIYHIYLSSGFSEPFCIEVKAINKYEAIGIVLSEYPTFCYSDITDILYEDCLEEDDYIAN